jgi:hypothetical protein
MLRALTRLRIASIEVNCGTTAPADLSANSREHFQQTAELA